MNKHGGKREGAGRKPEGKEPKKHLAVKVSKETREKVKKLAQLNNVSQAYIVELAIKRIRKIS